MKKFRINPVHFLTVTAATILIHGSALAELPPESWFQKEERTKTSDPKKLETTFESCKDIEITVDENRSKEICHSCTKQYAPEIKFVGGSLEKFVSHQQMIDFLSLVGERIIDNLNKQISHADTMIGCYKNSKKDNCPESLYGLDKKLQEIATDAMPLRSFPPNQKDWPEENKLYHEKTAELRSAAQASCSELKTLSFEHAYPAEHQAEQACRNMATSDKSKIQACSKLRADNKKLRANFKESGSAKVRELAFACANSGKTKRTSEIFEKKTLVPVSFFMSEPARFKNGRFDFPNKSMIKAHESLKQTAQRQIASIREAIQNGDLEHDKAMRLERLKSFAGKFDLLDLIAFKPVVEDILKTQKGFCGLATAIADRYSTRDVQNDLLAAGAMLGLGFAGGATVGAAAGLTGVGMQGLYVAGIALGSGFWTDAGLELSRTKDAAKLGVKTQDQVKEREREFAIALAAHPLDFFGASAVGKNLVRSMKGSLTKAAGNFADSPAAHAEFKALAEEAFREGKKLPKDQLAKTKETDLIAAAAKKRGLTESESQLLAKCVLGSSAAACAEAKTLLARLGDDIDFAAIAKRPIAANQIKQIQANYKTELLELRKALVAEDPNFAALAKENPAEAERFLIATVDGLESQGLKQAEVKARIHKALNECGL